MAITFSRVTLGPLARRGGRQAHNPVEWRKSKCCPASLISVSYFQYFQSTSTRVIKIYLLADPWPGPVTHTYTQYTVYYKDTLYTVCAHSTLSAHLYVVICEGATDYTLYNRLVVQQIVVQRCNRLYICNVMDVHCMLFSDSR